MTLQVEIRNRIVGGDPAQPQLPAVALTLLHQRITVRQLIAQAVEEQIAEMVLHQQADIARAERALARQYLTPEEIDAQAQTGQIMMPKLPDDSISVANQVQKALRAFQKGAFIIIVDGYQPADLDEELELTATSKITFLRLTPLVGG